MILTEDDINDLLREVGFAGLEKPATAVDDGVPANVDTILASTEKLLAVNQGLAEPDERDSLAYRRVFTPDKLMTERVDLDAEKLFRNTMRRLARIRSLRALTPGHFDDYTTGLLTKTSLGMPPEGINPMHLVEQNRRITQMGPGGLPGDSSITPEAQSVHHSEFGFIDVIAGPESSRAGVDVRLAHGTAFGEDGKLYHKFLNRRTGEVEWVDPARMVQSTLGIPE